MPLHVQLGLVSAQHSNPPLLTESNIASYALQLAATISSQPHEYRDVFALFRWKLKSIRATFAANDITVPLVLSSAGESPERNPTHLACRLHAACFAFFDGYNEKCHDFAKVLRFFRLETVEAAKK